MFHPGTSGGIPTPSIEYEYIWINKNAFKGIFVMVVIELVFCLICFPVMINYCKKHLTFRNTGLKLTFLFLIGCMLALSSVPFFGVDSQMLTDIDVSAVYTARIWLLNVGFTLSVGSLGVRVIYTSFIKAISSSEKKVLVRSSTVTCLVVGLAIFDTLAVVTFREFATPHKDYEIKEIEYVGLMDEKRTVIEKFRTDKDSLTISFFCLYKAVLLLVSLILTMMWKEKKEEFVQDFEQSRNSILTTVITSFVALPAVVFLRFNPTCSFVIGGLAILIQVALLLRFVIWNKIKKSYRCGKGGRNDAAKYTVNQGKRFIPCVNSSYGCVFTSLNRGYYSEEFYESELGLSPDVAEEISKSMRSTSAVETEFVFDLKEHEDPLPGNLGTFDEVYAEEAPGDENDEDEEDNEYVEMQKRASDSSSSDDSSDDSDAEKYSPYLNLQQSDVAKPVQSEQADLLLPEDKMQYYAKKGLPPIKSNEADASGTRDPAPIPGANKRVILPPIPNKGEKNVSDDSASETDTCDSEDGGSESRKRSNILKTYPAGNGSNRQPAALLPEDRINHGKKNNPRLAPITNTTFNQPQMTEPPNTKPILPHVAGEQDKKKSWRSRFFKSKEKKKAENTSRESVSETDASDSEGSTSENEE